MKLIYSLVTFGFLFLESQSLYAMNSEDLSQTDNYKRGMSLWRKGEFDSAFKIIKEEAEKNHIFALYDLAGMYAQGIGTEKSPQLYFDYCKKAAEEGSLLARNQLGVIYEFGLKGIIEKDEEKAINNYMQAAEGGLEIAIKNLERVLEEVTEYQKPSTPPSKKEKSISNVSTADKEFFEGIDPKVIIKFEQYHNQEIEKAIEKAIEKGSLNTSKNIAKRLLKAGDDAEKVANCTGLTLEQVTQIKDEL